MRQTKANIYLGNSRIIISTADADCRQTFEKEFIESPEYDNENAFVILNDVTIKGESFIDFVQDGNQIGVLLPIVGGLEISDFKGEITYLTAGEIIVFSDFVKLKIRNPYPIELVNFLELRFEQKNLMKMKTQRHLPRDFQDYNYLI